MSSDSGIIFDLRRFSIHDGPGIRTTVFLKGCPLSCWWCHNPESQSRQPERIYRDGRCILCAACVDGCPRHALSRADGRIVVDAALCEPGADCIGECAAACYAGATELAGRAMTVAEVLAQVLPDVPFYDQSGGGVTLSGGEPLMQARFCEALLAECRRREIHTALDTSGCAPWDTLERLRPLTGLFLYDLKLMDDARHRAATGVSNRLILDNLRRLVKAGADVVARIPVIPGVNDDEGNLRASATFLSGLGGVRRVDLLPYHPTAEAKYARLGREYRLAGTAAQSDAQMQSHAGIFAAQGLDVSVGG